ncbi:hypothetical protein GPB2148_2273 [marine gamma proteobacterium HTCC2148]|jgi:hypothetical protein|nr:hypothetical protein GPB2148_2273 [marine gamma proteobacterium HTCC2148]
MTHRTLAEVGLCLTVLQEDMDPLTPKQDQFDAIESTAIAILDSEFEQYIPGALQEYLQTYLYLKQMELGLIQFPDPLEA